MHKHFYIKNLLLTMVAATTVPSGLTLAQEKPNVLMIMVDDLRTDLGCYGDKMAITPNIDNLAKQGLLFHNAYCQQAVCAPSRMSLLTGKRPENLQIFDIQTPLRSKWPDMATLPGLFVKNDYYTASVGKVYHHRGDDMENWNFIDELQDNRYGSPQILELIQEKYMQAHARGLRGRELNHAARGPSTERSDLPETSFIDGLIANEAIRKLQELKDKNFFMCVGFKKPHLPFSAPAKYWDLYDRNSFSISYPEKPAGMPEIAATNWAELRSYIDIPETGNVSLEKALELKHGYYACISFIDDQVGKLLNTLKDLALQENTIVILVSDHGWKLGEYNLWCKHTNFELDVHVPLIFRGPGIPGGKKTNALFDYVDIFPTLAAMADLKYSNKVDGVDQSSVIINEKKDIRKFSYSLYPRGQNMGFTITNGRYRYTAWIDQKGELLASELYEHRNDRISRNNLSGLRKYRKVEKILSEELTKHYKIKPN